jgi:hypothetical protein
VSVFQALNSWIIENQALVISAGVPLFTLVVTGWASFLSHRAKVADTRLNGRVKLSEYRRSNFDEVLRLSGRLQSIFFETAMRNARDPASSARNLLPPPAVNDLALSEVIECSNLFLLRSKANVEQTKYFSDCLHLCIDRIFWGVPPSDPKENILGVLRVICKEILDQEWAQIVKELEGTAP